MSTNGQDHDDQRRRFDAQDAVETAGTDAAAEVQGVVDPWAQAFATLEDKDDKHAAGAEEGPGTGTAATGEQDAQTGEAAAAPAAGGDDRVLDAADAGGSVPDAGPAGAEDGVGAGFDVEEQLTQYAAQIEEQAISDTARLFLERADEKGNKLIRQSDGRLGATINDPDIYRVDPETGVATFYNPETGRPFTGDNPRAQAMEWVELYNKQLREVFNDMAQKRQEELEQEMAPVIEMLKFTPKYEKLDPVRQRMLDALIEGYEVYDSDGEHIGYSIDLDKALDQVNRQVAAIQAERKAGQEQEPVAPTGPALDMPTTSTGSGGSQKRFTSLAEALEAQQNAQLEQLRNR